MSAINVFLRNLCKEEWEGVLQSRTEFPQLQ